MGKTLGYGEITVANMTEPFTVMLTNEAQQFATDSNRKVTSAQSYYTDIIVIRGSQERTDYTIGNITSGSGITVSKSSKRVTFSVSAGTTIGADTGVIEIPITLDGQTVKKQFSWSCGKQGPQGVKGQDGTSVKITSKSVTYQTSTSGTTAPTGTWLTTVPTVNNGQYLWTKTTVQYSDGNKTEAYSVSYKGTNGTNGTSVTVSKTEVTYQVSTSGTTAPTGAWSTTMPTCDQGQYLWTKTYVKYSDGKETTSYSVSYKGVDGEKFSWNLIQNGKGNEKRGFFKNFSSVNITEGYGEITLTSKHNYIGIGLSGFVLTPRQYEVGEKITWSYDIMYTKWDFPTGSNRQELWMGQRYTNAASGETATGQWVGVTAHDLPVVGQNGCELNKWFHVEVTKTIPAQASSNVGYQGIINFYNSTDISATVTLRMKNVKLEYGDTATPWSPAQSDLEGRGVSQTVQYYLATSQASGVTSSTSGWSTDITTQKLTADKKYLWNCYQTKYSDGTSEPISTPKVIGVYGDKGQNAKNLSITPSSQYFKSTDGGKTFAPNAITIKPTIQGEISFGKWQYSIDGGVSFADVVSGQKGLTVSNNVLAVSKDSSLYSDAVTMVIFRAVADDSSFYDTCSIAKIYDVSDIGDGRNLWITRDNITLQACEKDKYIYTTTGTSAVCIGADAASVGTNTIALQTGTKYTISFVISSPSEVGNARWYFCTALNSTGVKNYGGYGVKLVTGENIVSQTITVDTSCDAAGLVLYHLPTGCVIKDIQVEKGSSPTGWTPAPEDVQTAILSTKSEISDVSLKVDKNKQAIEQRVEKTTYQQDLNLVKGDISKANEGLNKWRYEIYPKSLFASEYQGKSTMDVFAKNTNLTPSQSVLINDTDFGKNWAYGDNYIGYALTFVKFSAAKSVAITFKHDDGAHLYLNGKLIGGDDTCNTGSGESLTLSFIQGWNCLEVVLNEKSGGEYIGLGTTISAISECQLMNCYYGTPVARQSHITNQLVQNTTDIDGVSGSVQKVMSTVGDSGKIDEFVSNYATWKKKVDGIETRVGETYTTKDDFDDLQIGGRNLLKHSSMIGEKLICDNYFICNNCNIQEYTNDGFHIITPTEGNANNGIAFAFDNFTIMEINGGDTITFSCDIKGTSDSHAPFVSIHISDNNWYGSGVVQKNTNVSITKDWQRVSVTITTPTGLTKNHMWLAIHGNHQSDLYVRNFKLEKGNKPTDWTPAPEDVNGKIVNAETIANQTANKFSWIVKGGDSSSNFTLTDRVADLVAERINFKGLVTFSGLNTDAKNEIGKVAQSKVDGLEIGGRNLIINSNLSRTLTNVTNDGCSNMTVVSDSVYGHALKFTAVNQRRVFWATSNVWVKNKTYTVSFVAKSSVTGQKIRPSRSTADWGDDITLTTSYARYTTKITSLDTNAGGTLSFSCTNAVGDITITNVKLEVGNKATDWTPAPEDVSQDATNKASQALTDAKNYSSNAVNWVTNNGSSTTSLNSMVKKWTDGAVSDTVQINGGWIKANTITASKIALADFTNYSQLTRDTADAYGFTVTDDTDGTWFSTKNIKRDQFISEIFPCNGGESYLIEYDISTNAKGANNSTDTKNYIGVAIGVYGYTGTVGSNGLPNKATNIWYADRITGSETAPSIHVKTTITTSTATKQFRVFLQSNGYYFEGTTKIRNLSVRRMYGGTLIVDGSITADKIATDAIKSRNYISSGGTQGSFLNLSDGSFQSPNLSWDSNGNLIAKNANLSGEITATNGSIAGWTIISNKMYTTGSGKYTGIGKYGSAYAFWAGATSNDNGNSAVFKVGHTGKLTATDADITGTITATNGKIGRYDITSTYLMTNSGSNASGIGGNQAFWAGAEDSNSAPFRVGYDGVLWAENAAIRGSIETGNLGDEGDTVSIINGHIGIQGTSNNVEIYSTGFKFGIDGDYYLMSVSEGVKCYRNLYATDFVADGWLYCSEVHSSGAVVIGADSESFYWAHGYQIARGTSWGGVCVGDDSQQLRLYGSSIWASHSISTSDENLKENFTTLDQYENFYMNLNPIGFNYIGDYDGKKTHFGFGAHKTEDVLESEGYDADKFAVVTHRPLVQEDIEKRFGKDVEVDIETEYGVSYTEFIALNTHMIQKTRRELTKVKQEKADLEVRLQAIEAKLGL